MPDRLRFIILGCGSSLGVPRANGEWGACNRSDNKNRRSRASLLIERISMQGRTIVVIDTGPDFRTQMINAGVSHIDAVIYTHGHADHTNGIDDLRTFVKDDYPKLMDVYADKETFQRLYEGFEYCFTTPEDSNYPPILRAHEIVSENEFTILGKGGAIAFQAYMQIHGNIHSLGFRIGNVAYCTDVSAFPDSTEKKLIGLDLLIIDALQYKSHPSHFSLEQTLNWVKILAPKRAVLTHMHTSLDYNTINKETPKNVEAAYDGMTFEVNNIM
ncbi:MAG: 2-cyclic phosphate phosphodiesterase [Candidatus Tokpelaia sp. JSC188]|nr:MAG: 2-cyclic phosphate phosphodiesterase [Candidatus Tokpelaia sp. JSC188]